MKKTFFITFSIILLSSIIVLAQTYTAKSTDGKNDMLSFGGNVNASAVSIMQVMDYPVLQLPEEDQTVVSYEFKIVATEGQAKVITVESSTLSRETLDYLREFVGEKGKISIGKVVVRKGEVILETPYHLELNFNQ